MNSGTPPAGPRLDDEDLESRLQRLHEQTQKLTHRHLALASWMFEQRVLAEERRWRRRHLGAEVGARRR